MFSIGCSRRALPHLEDGENQSLCAGHSNRCVTTCILFPNCGTHEYGLSLTSHMCIPMSFPGSHTSPQTHFSRPTTQGTSFPPPWQAFSSRFPRSIARCKQTMATQNVCISYRRRCHVEKTGMDVGNKFFPLDRHHIISIYLQHFLTSMSCGKNWQR